ncbi:hypothetical protein [Microscilla marina]|uniref:Uncharacterized protein n=1 Tax=Microscilla marina ATCC 23134 TaxID=313606 RepID=A1ZTE3_MICM2|nr:hypothetical protein [Microscilla marina]EAY26365.1 hypothetical protein M23134_04643 [Microscilla marina ATCC 23134]
MKIQILQKNKGQSFPLSVLVFLFSIFLSMVTWANDTLRTDTTIVLKPSHIVSGKTPALVKPPPLPKNYQLGSTRSFAGLNGLQALPIESVDMHALYQQRLQRPMTDSVRKIVNKIEADLKKVTEENLFVKTITSGELVKLNLPQGVTREIGGKEYTLVLHGVHFRKGDGYIQVSMKLPIPESKDSQGKDRALYFWGQVGFTQGGAFQQGRIGLLVDFPMKFGDNILTFENSTLGAQNPDGTFVTFDCNGFKNMGVKGQLEFSRNVLVPETAAGKRDPDTNNRVKGSFNAVVGGWNDILLEIDLPQRFQAARLPRFGFVVKQAVLDLSDERNAAGQQFPAGYAESYLPDGNSPLWRGLSIKEFRLYLPPEFKKTDNNQASSAGLYIVAQNALIDKQGFTGEISGTNIIAKGQGKMGKWPFSVEQFYVKMEATQLRAAHFGGKVRLPISKDDPSAYLGYTVIINPDAGDYVAQVRYNKNMKLGLWVAQMEVLPSSSLELGVQNGEFLARATLNGKFTDIGGKKFSKTLQMKDIDFERMVIQTQAPYLSVGAMSLGSIGKTQKLGGFTFTLEKIGFIEGEAERLGQTGLQVGGKVNFVQGKNGFGAEAYGTIYGRLEDTPLGFQVPVFEDVELNKIGIDIDMGAFRLAGRLQFYKNNDLYGRGFRGDIQAAFGKSKMRINVKASAMFGNVGGFNYWFADALATFTPGIPLVANGIQLGGFGGGAYYHMKRAINSNFSNQLGATRSGISYEPDKATFLGIKASVMLMGPNPSTYNGEAGFEIAFNRNGGLRKIGFDARLDVATPTIEVDIGVMKKMTAEITKMEQAANKASGGLLSKLTSKSKGGAQPSYSASGNGAIRAVARIDFDIPNSTLHANLSVDINVAGGAIKGGGEAVFHFAPDTWYVHIGTPERRIGVNIMGVIQTGAYFMVGDHIPEMPAPPENVIRILGLQSEYNTQRDDAAMLAGKGFSFGANFSMDTGNMSFLMFYARFAAGLGFDVMLKKYGDGVSCKGRPGGVGINNWYAQGQVYGFFEGEIGIRVNLPFKKGNFPIIQGELAALMQAQLPNPVWIRGIVGGRFSILGGLIKGSCKFELEIGKKCELVGGSALDGVEIISDVSPAAGTPEVGVFTSPQATFNLAVNKTFELKDPVADKLKRFRVKLDYFKVTARTTGQAIEGKIEWNEDHTALSFVPKDILPSEKVMNAEVQVSFEEGTGGVWKPVAGVVEKKSMEFKTGKAPDHITRQNIAYSYPVIQQLNFHVGETSQGYIQLKQGRPDLLADEKTQSLFDQKLRFVAANNPKVFKELPFVYDRANVRINFAIPQDLSKEVVYHWQIVNIPKGKAARVDENVTNVVKKNNSANVSVTSKKLEGSRSVLKEKNIFNAPVRTSAYATFADKFNALTRTSGWSWPIATSVHVLGATYTGKETFDLFEIAGEGGKPALVELEALIANTPWYQNVINPLIYQNLSRVGLERSVKPFGIPPFKAMFINQKNWQTVLSEETLQATKPAHYRGAFIFNIPSVVQRDYMDLVYKAAALKLTTSAPWIDRILTTPFPSISTGSYEAVIRYRLPGSNRVTFERKFTIINPGIKD